VRGQLDIKGCNFRLGRSAPAADKDIIAAFDPALVACYCKHLACSLLTLDPKRIPICYSWEEEVDMSFLHVFTQSSPLSSVVPHRERGLRGETQTKDLIVVCSGYNLPARGGPPFSLLSPAALSVQAIKKCKSLAPAAPVPPAAPEKAPFSLSLARPGPAKKKPLGWGIDRDLIPQSKT
jgi:hypothetical protein